MPLQLQSTHVFLRVYQQTNRPEPLIERQMGAIENRACSGGELLFAARLQALIELRSLVVCILRHLARDARDFLGAARKAAHAVGPAARLEVGQALLFGSKGLRDFYQFHRLLRTMTKMIVIATTITSALTAHVQ